MRVPDCHPHAITMLLVTSFCFSLFAWTLPLPEIIDHLKFAPADCNVTNASLIDRPCCEATQRKCSTAPCGEHSCDDDTRHYEDNSFLDDLRHHNTGVFPKTCCGKTCCVGQAQNPFEQMAPAPASLLAFSYWTAPCSLLESRYATSALARSAAEAAASRGPAAVVGAAAVAVAVAVAGAAAVAVAGAAAATARAAVATAHATQRLTSATAAAPTGARRRFSSTAPSATQHESRCRSPHLPVPLQHRPMPILTRRRRLCPA